MKKILFVVDERKLGGVSIVLENIFNEFKNIDFDLLVLHDNGDKLSNIKNVNLIFGSAFFETCDIKMIDVLKSLNFKLIVNKIILILLLKTGLIKNKIIKERKKILNKQYDIEICFKDGIGTYFCAYGDGKCKIRWMHADYSNNNPGKKYRKSYTCALNEYDKFVAISESIGKKFNEVYHKENETEVIYNIMRISKIEQPHKSNRNNKLLFSSIGRLNKIKGFDRVIKAIARLNDDGLFNNAVYKIVGDGEEREYLSNLIDKLNLNEKVKLLGSSATPWDLVNDSDLFILSSYSEAFPTTIIESLSNHIPVFSVEYSSIHEMLNDNNSIIVKNSDEEIYVGLKKILENTEILYNLKKNVLSYKYDNKKSIEKLNKLFME